jgi:ubiquinone/menaquinone biosynthesis C-methylase UbiE
MVYRLSARVYDALYNFKNYAAEVETLNGLIAVHALKPVQTLLDVACGTGAHLVFLKDRYTCTGIDLSPEQLDIAREKLPGVTFCQGDMLNFDFGTTFDAVVCLFSSIGYIKTVELLRLAINNMARHVVSGGTLVVEPWFGPGEFKDGHVSASFVDEPELKIARMSVSHVDGRLSIMDMHHLVATPAGVEHFVEHHEMGLFTHEEYLDAVAAAGLNPVYNEQGLTGRGLYIGVKPA